MKDDEPHSQQKQPEPNPPEGSAIRTNTDNNGKCKEIASQGKSNVSESQKSVWIAPVILQLAFDFILVVATTTYAVFAIKQWSTMQGQLGQMQQSGSQTDKMLCLIRQQVEKMAQQVADADTLAAAAGTQAEASLRSAKAQETANKIVTRQFQISQSAQIALVGINATSPVSVAFSNIGQTDAKNVIVQSAGVFYSSRDLVGDFDPLKGLQEFRASPTKDVEIMARSDKEHEEMYRRMGENEMADKIHAAAKERHLHMTPKRIIPSIPRGGGFRERLDSIQWNVVVPTKTPQSSVIFVFILTDWDDIFGTHHANDLCFTSDETGVNFCVTPISK